ncbi:sodium-dependent phosphate transporter [Penaeus vannamei]|uniref:Sodium-dependent phosphate transporter n=1 Tax=Penaeus vannamei TaxID=6689 RepID=A0A423S9N6_PENVA|nr:sodium-dependent phosphate transporter [Penaeus vannamei]
MVAADFLDVPTAVPIIMGANIGTSITNTLVSIGQVGDREQFERAFSGAVIHDMFNWLCVLVLLPLEVTTGYLYHLTRVILSQMTLEHNNMKVEILSRITKPFTNRIVQLDKKVLTGWTMNDPAYENATLLRRLCPQTSSGNTSELVTCSNLAAHLPFPDNGVGVFLLIASSCMLCCLLSCGLSAVYRMQSGRGGEARHQRRHPPRALAHGLPGHPRRRRLGVITVERVYPLTLGSNLGTTTTALLAALASDSSSLRAAIQIALVHLFFNVSGLLLWYPIPFLRFPVPMAKSLGAVTAKYRWFAIVYMALTFGILPLFVFLVSLGGPVAMYSVFVPLGIVVLIIVFINVAQNHFPKVLPTRLRTWSWLPLPLRSLQPYDDVITRLMCCVRLRPSYRYATVPPATAAAQNAPDTLDVLSVIEPSKNPVKVCDLGDGLVAEVVQVHDSDAPATLVIHHETSA